MKPSRVSVLIAFAITLVLPLRGTTGVALQMQLGNPSRASADAANHSHYLIQRAQYALDYADAIGQPLWVSWDLTNDDVGPAPRSTTYFADTALPLGFYALSDGDYAGVGTINYNRGHMCPSEDRTATTADNLQVFFMTNIVPQASDNNQGPWEVFEAYCRTLAAAGNELLIISGPSGFTTPSTTIPSGKAAIAAYVWKIAVVVPLGSGSALSRINSDTRVIALKVPNLNGIRSAPWQSYVTSAAQIEADTGFKFFTALPAAVAETLRAKNDSAPTTINNVVKWDFSSVSPASGLPADRSVTASGVIAGNNNGTTTLITSASASTTYVGASAGNNAGVAARTGTLKRTEGGSAYFEFTFSPLAGMQVEVTEISFGSRSTSTGPQALRIFTSVDGFAVPVASRVVNANSNWALISAGMSSVRGAVAMPVTFRIYGYDGSGSAATGTANWRIDDLSVRVAAMGAAQLTNASPTIVAQPLNQTVAATQTAVFSVSATGAPTPTYQWRKDGVAILGATNATYAIKQSQSSDAGNYTVVITNTAGSITSTAGALTVTLSRLVNLSILTSLATTGDSFTLGYVVGGSGAKPLVIRAAGPSLGALGVPGTMDDPKIELFAGSTKIQENDNWGGSATLSNAMSAVGAFAYTGPNSRDAAVVLAVATGDNSVKVSGPSNSTGTVLAEIYDATPASSFTSATPRLVNVSVLKNVGNGITVGFVVDGNGTKNLLLRAIGPTLESAFGIGGAVSDPQLTLYSGQTVIGSNDNWGGRGILRSAFVSAGAFALADESRDAAAVVSLKSGSYTVAVSGVGTSTGSALVEIYELPEVSSATLPAAPTGFVGIPASTFTMGDDVDGSTETPLRAVTLGTFYVSRTETSKAEWDQVREWAATHGYTDLPVGEGKADNHPVQKVSWFEAVKWCNAKSERDGLEPAYYTNSTQTTVYRVGIMEMTNSQVKWTATGYRLPTEAEWEYAARGGLDGRRFPWGDTITHQQANYLSSASILYDVSVTRGMHPSYSVGNEPFTSPVGSFVENGFGLQDMAGNVWEWCWDWFGSCGNAAVNAPQGPSFGSARVFRGGSWLDGASYARCAANGSLAPESRGNSVGFRQVRSSFP